MIVCSRPSDRCDFDQKNNKTCQQITTSKHTMTSPCDIYCTSKESCKLKTAFCAICYEYTGPNCPASVLKYNSS